MQEQGLKEWSRDGQRRCAAIGGRGVLRCAALLLLLAAASTPLRAQSGGTAALNVPWSPLAPQSLTTATEGAAGGRVLSVALDPGDSTGNTLYIGTTGGVFK